jgi:hypothetical protein
MTDEEILKFIFELQTIDIVTHRKKKCIPDNDWYAYYREDHRWDIEHDGLVSMYKYLQNYLFGVCRKSSKIILVVIGGYEFIRSDPIIKTIFPDDIKMAGRFIYLPVRNFGSTYTKFIEPIVKFVIFSLSASAYNSL